MERGWPRSELGLIHAKPLSLRPLFSMMLSGFIHVSARIISSFLVMAQWFPHGCPAFCRAVLHFALPFMNLSRAIFMHLGGIYERRREGQVSSCTYKCV